LYYWLFINEAGEQKPHYGRFTIVDHPAKVQYTWMSLHTRGLESLVTVTFQKKGEDTLLTLRHENLPDDDYGRGHEKGWGQLVSHFLVRSPPDVDRSCPPSFCSQLPHDGQRSRAEIRARQLWRPVPSVARDGTVHFFETVLDWRFSGLIPHVENCPPQTIRR